MGLYTTLPNALDEVDVIITGGGTAGCIIAARLAEADPDLSILAIESGGNNDLPTIAYPGFFFVNLSPASKSNIFYQGNKEQQLDGRELVVPSGGVLGGGSSTNLMMYTRAQRSDFDSWEAPGWSADDILPYLKKLETYHGPGSKEFHGDAGPVQISGGPFRSSRAEQDVIDAIAQVGWSEIEDLQNLDACNGIQRAVRYVSLDGKRQDVASRYLHPKLVDGKYPNLYVLLETQVVRVVIENQRATGVEFTPNPLFQPGSHPTRVVKARKLVVVSGGACGTPPIIERSGVGDPEILQRAGVSVQVNLPGVGRDYQDHQLLVYPYRSSLKPEETLDGAMRAREPEELIKCNAGVLGWNAMDVTCKLRPTEADVASLGNDFERIWNRDFKGNENRPLAMMSVINAFPGDPSSVPPGQYFAVTAFSVYPYSRGHMHITGPNPDDRLDFTTGYFSDAEGFDIKTHVWIYKTQREIVRRMQTYRGEVAAAHPPFPASSPAASIEIDAPLQDVQNLTYSAEDDTILEKWLRQNVNTTWHSLGTCKMAPRDQNGVVDARLGVYGVEALKVADLSVPPKNVAANTNNTAMAIGEKAADIFIEELHLRGTQGK